MFCLQSTIAFLALRPIDDEAVSRMCESGEHGLCKDISNRQGFMHPAVKGCVMKCQKMDMCVCERIPYKIGDRLKKSNSDENLPLLPGLGQDVSNKPKLSVPSSDKSVKECQRMFVNRSLIRYMH